jgi:hypothetical protein
VFAPNSNLRAKVTASQRGKNSPKLVNIENGQSNKPYHARGMTWAQRLKRVFNIDITECEKCQKHTVTIIACIIDSVVIRTILAHLDKKYPNSTPAATLLPHTILRSRVLHGRSFDMPDNNFLYQWPIYA